MVGQTIEVIIPVRDMADHLPKLLRPILDQLGDGDRVTVVENLSFGRGFHLWTAQR